LVQEAETAISELGGENVVVASLTRAAAFEFMSRGLSAIPHNQIGTLHSLCLKATEITELAETDQGKKAWNEFIAPHHSEWKLSGASGPEGMDETQKRTEGDALLGHFSYLRALDPPEPPDRNLWPLSLQGFVSAWETWKHETQRLDFTDLILLALETTDTAPGNPRRLFGDEAQDWSPLEIRLFRDHWGHHAEKVMLVGDEDQTLYVWRGADPHIFLDHPVPENQKILLNQSYRVPRAVRNAALAWISSEIDTREPVEYFARPVDGLLRFAHAGYDQPHRFHTLIEEIVAREQSVMILASCAYMLRPMLAALREWSLPFHNPYRVENGAWNPIRRGSSLKQGGKAPAVTKLDRLLAFQCINERLFPRRSREWTWEDLHRWTAPLRSTGADPVLTRGAKTRLATLAETGSQAGGAWTDAEFAELFVGGWNGPHAHSAAQGDLDWWLSAMRASETKGYQFMLNILKNRGIAALLEKPRVILGTIHSVKGGEADHVILFPDLSYSGAQDYWEDPAPTARLFYVGMTRAREGLILGENSGETFVDLWRTLRDLADPRTDL